MTAVTPIRRPDELLDKRWAAGGRQSWPGRAVDPGDTEGAIQRPQWFPRTPTETACVYRRG